MFRVRAGEGIGTIIKCEECPHPEVGRNPAYEWTDSNGDVFFEGATLASLLNFIAEHTS